MSRSPAYITVEGDFQWYRDPTLDLQGLKVLNALT
jgi:hypothetical protein